jgi:hypothetical protein
VIASPQLRSELRLVLRGRRSRTSSMAGIGRNRNGGFGAERAESCRSLKFFNRGKQSRPATCYRAGYWGLGAALARESLVERERPGQIARSGSVEVQNGRRQSRVAPFRRNAVIGCPRYRWIGPSHFILGCDHHKSGDLDVRRANAWVVWRGGLRNDAGDPVFPSRSVTSPVLYEPSVGGDWSK